MNNKIFYTYTILLLICDVVIVAMIIRMGLYEKELDKKDDEIYVLEEYTSILENKLSAYECYVDGGWNCE
jgi:hypothetical protein